MELINEEQTGVLADSDFQLTAEVLTDVAIIAELPVGDSALPEVTLGETAPEPDLFVFEAAGETVLPLGELTPFEQQVLTVVLTGNYDPFDPFYVGQDGAIDTALCGDVWWGASVLINDLTNADVAPEDFAAVATEWFLA